MTQTENKAKEPMDGFFGMILGRLGASLLENISYECACDRVTRAGLILPHPLTNL